MFANIPQRFTTPFGILGDEAKLRFRSLPTGISKLASTRHIRESDEYWKQFVELFDTPSDVFSLVTPHDIRRALLEAPENVATLIRVLCKRLSMLISDHTFPTPPAAGVTGFASSFMKGSAGAPARNATREVLNCIRVLSRVFPVVFEIDGQSNVFELELLWKRPRTESVPSADSPQFVIDDEGDDDNNDDTDADADRDASMTSESNTASQTLPSLAEKLFSSLLDLLFCCGFTLPTTIQVDHHKINYTIWESGVGASADHTTNTNDAALVRNRTEVLRLLLVLLSRQIYVAPSVLFTCPSLYTVYFVQKTPRRIVLTLLCSLLNTVMNSASETHNGIATKLPTVFKGDDVRVGLITICLQVLDVLLDFQSGTARDRVCGNTASDGQPGEQTSVPAPSTNAFRYALMKLHRTQDFEFVLNGIIGILEQQMAAMGVNNLLPGTKKDVPYITETIIFFWKMLELNKKFRAHLLESAKCMSMVAYLLCYALEIKDRPEQHGLCRALSYIVQTLSAEPAFGLHLTSPLTASVSTKWQVQGTAGDFLICSIYAIVATTNGTLNALFPALVIALSNFAPYFRNLSIQASSRLVQLFTAFANPTFLLSDEGHPRLLFFMLEAFNGVIQHHLAENPNLVYALLTSHRVFEDLGTFTLMRGLREIRRVQQAREQFDEGKNGHDKERVSNERVGKSSSEDASPAEKLRPLHDDLENALGLRDLDASSDDAGNGSSHRAATDEVNESAPVADAGPTSASEKARGKMKASRSSSTDGRDSLEQIAAAGLGRHGFVPTQDWVTSWQQGLPLDTVMLVITELLPKVQEMQAPGKAHRSAVILDFLASVTLQDVLPSPGPIIPRTFVWSDASTVWLTSLIWGEIYVKGMTPLGIWNATNVRLFYVKHTQAHQRQISETVRRLLGRNTSDASISRQPRTT
ncbi:hypothetical protein FISHEDRAFT_38523 [Fistulina hepatica ATCC 64428]|nr:hypothetical protein FISHEDRAFT_38523 [Fistulina hepatica ATCC 64428]